MSTEIQEPKTYADLRPRDLVFVKRGHGHATNAELAFVANVYRDVQTEVEGEVKQSVIVRGADLSLFDLFDDNVEAVSLIVLAEGGVYEEYEVTP